MILFLDVDGAPFLSFEMLSLVRAGRQIAFAPSRPVPDPLVSGEFAPLRERLVQIPLVSPRGLTAFVGYLFRRPRSTVAAVATAVAAYVKEPRYLLKLLGVLNWTFAVARWGERNGARHVHANWAHLPATSAWILSQVTGLPFSFSGHAGRDLYRTGALLARKVTDARFVVVCNEAARRRVLGVTPEEAEGKVRLVYHGIDLGRFRLRQAEGQSRVLSVGSLDPAKGFDVAVEAVAEVRSRGRPLGYRIIGAGPERKRLEALAERLAVPLEITGWLRGSDLVEACDGATAFLMPSRILAEGGRDGLPNALLEAMALGVPVCASRVGGIPEAVEHERTGLLVPPEDPSSLANAILRLIEDRSLRERLRRGARERVVREFDRSRTVRAYCASFEGEAAGGTTRERVP